MKPLIEQNINTSTKEKESESKKKNDLSGHDVRWLTELPDELDVMVALRLFDDAVTAIEKGIFYNIFKYDFKVS